MRLPGRASLAGGFLAALSGVATGLTQPKASLLVLLPFCLVPFLVSLRGVSVRRGLVAGLLFGTAFWLMTISWIAFTVHRFGEVGVLLSWIAVVLGALFLAIPFGLMGAALVALDISSPGGLLLGFPAAWVVQEAVRTHVLGGFPWALLAAPLADVPELAQSAALGGILLTSALVALLNALISLLVSPGSPRVRALGGGGAVILAALAWIGGAARIRNLEGASGPGFPPIRVALLQPGVGQELRMAPSAQQKIWADLVDQTRLVAETCQPDLVLWPESACPRQWPWSEALRRELPALCRETGAAVLFNTVWSDQPWDDDAPFYNSALLVDASGAVLPPYHKQRLVPFGEYVPLAALLRWIRPISRAVPSSFSPGHGAALIPFRGAVLGGAICYEIVYPWIARREVAAGATVLFTLTNDSWYGTAGARRQHWQGAVFRAIETGRPLLRAAVTGITGVVDAAGRSETIPIDRRGALTVVLGSGPNRIGPVKTPAAVTAGESVAVICALGLLAGILSRRVFRPQRPDAGEPSPSRRVPAERMEKR